MKRAPVDQIPSYPNYRRFTDRVRTVMELATAESRRFKHDCLSTGHILIALRREGRGVAAVILKGYYDLSTTKLRNEMTRTRLPEGTNQFKLPSMTLSMSRDVEYVLSKGASDESNRPDFNYIGTEHLLLAMSKIHDCTAASILRALGVNLDDLILKTRTVLGYGL